jgi:hypothetical protein
VIAEHKSSGPYRTAVTADEYDAQRNTTIRNFAQTIVTATGGTMVNDLATNTKLASNFFARLNTQRCTYSLGNGITFQADGVEGKLGQDADKIVKDAGYYSLIHGSSFLFWAYDHIHVFKLTEFAPLWDENTSALGAGVRFWQLAHDKPLHATLYTEDGFMEFVSDTGSSGNLQMVDGQIKPYRMNMNSTPATTGDVLTAHNYGRLPIIPLWGSRLRQSTLVGMQQKIDAFDIIQSGYCNDIRDCAEIYWTVSGAGGMTDKDLAKFRERLMFRHIAAVNGDDVKVEPYTQEPPYASRIALLESLESQIYKDFGYLDVTNISGGTKTATEINAAYQPLDENADDFEYQVIEAIRNLLALQGVSAADATPQFKRNRVSNSKEQVEVLMLEAPYLDDRTILQKLPNISSEEVEEIMARKASENLGRLEDEEDGEENP